MERPKAPRDPIAKGSSFYICRQKEVVGNPTPDGGGVQYIYLDGVRLITFAKMVGNITDENMLKNLVTAEGFLSMVAGIGVTIEADEREQEIIYAFQMYGKGGDVGAGDTIRVSCMPDGMEKIIWLDDYSWSEKNEKVGQMRFEFEKSERIATVDVKLYLREGYTAPEQEEQSTINMEGEAYQALLERSFMSMGNYARVKRVLEKAKRGEEVTIAFVGGSITQGAGATPIHHKAYAYQTWERFRKIFGENVRLIKAGVGGTPSELGMIRFERDVLRGGSVRPDLIVVEFAVNDEGDETKGLCYESLVRKCLALSEETAVMLLFAVFADDENLEERLVPVGERYELPMVSIRRAVVPQFYLKANEGRVLAKSQFFYDIYHPANIGHTIMADCLMYMLKKIDEAPMIGEADWRDKTPVYGTDFQEVRLMDKAWNTELAEEVVPGSFCETDKELQFVEMDDILAPVPEFPNNWQHVSGTEPFSMKLKCRALLLVSKDSGNGNAGKAVVLVDGKEVLTADPHAIGWTHCNPQILINEKKTENHRVEIRMVPGDEEKKFTILGFGIVE